MTIAHGRGTLMRLRCFRCGHHFVYRVWKGSPRYCSGACRQAAYRERVRAQGKERRRVKPPKPRIDL